MTFSMALMLKNTCRFWKVRLSPQAANRLGATPPMGRPSKRTCPADGV